MSEKFHLLMTAVDEDLLEEAMTPVAKRKPLGWIGAAIAACLLLVMGFGYFPSRGPAVTVVQLTEMGYDMRLPDNAEQVSYEMISLADMEGVQASFQVRDTKYVYQAVKTQQELQIFDTEADSQVLCWNAGDLDIRLVSSASSTSVSWYTSENQTQWYLTAHADALEVLTTASQILRAIGLDVTVAPEGAEEITYNAFSLDGLTVAETTFRIDGITYTYRMAGTLELQEDFADISGLTGSFDRNTTGDVYWCGAKLSFQEGGAGKIIWFDLVPGILYSLSVDSGANAEMLLDMANSLFEPAQDNN